MLFRSNAYSLILMDIQMPKLDGLEATRRIRSMDDDMVNSPDIPILAMTANVFPKDQQDCLDAGMNDFVGKPFNPQSLYSKIVKWID